MFGDWSQFQNGSVSFDDLDLQDKLGFGHKLSVDNEELRLVVKAQPEANTGNKPEAGSYIGHNVLCTNWQSEAVAEVGTP